jgi:hypothetical protein
MKVMVFPSAMAGWPIAAVMVMAAAAPSTVLIMRLLIFILLFSCE